MDSHEQVRARMTRRGNAYRAIFQAHLPSNRPWWAFWRKEKAVLTQTGAVVLADLARYCYATKTTMKISQTDQHADPLAMAYAEGRRDVYLWITNQLSIDSAEIDQTIRSRSSNA